MFLLFPVAAVRMVLATASLESYISPLPSLSRTNRALHQGVISCVFCSAKFRESPIMSISVVSLAYTLDLYCSPFGFHYYHKVLSPNLATLHSQLHTVTTIVT